MRPLPPTVARFARAATAALALAALAPGAAGAVTGGRPYIVNGEKAETGDYPFMASLQFKQIEGSARQRHFCGGTLIDEEWVLTAAHCAEFLSPSDVSVVVGRTRLESDEGVVRDVAEIVLHPAWNAKQIAPDVALLRLSAPVDRFAPLEPVRPAERALWEAGDPAATMGWGVQSEEGMLPPDDLRVVDLPIQADGTMGSPEVYGEDFLPDDMLGAGPLDGGAGACYGDSGGPLLVSDGAGHRQIGIVSWGGGCGADHAPTVYARIGEGRIRNFLDLHIPLRVADVRTAERDGATFVVALGRPSTLAVSVSYTTVAVTATSGEDFVPAAGTITIPPGATSAAVTVPIVEDTTPERDETLRFTVTSLANAIAGDTSAVGTILDDDLS